MKPGTLEEGTHGVHASLDSWERSHGPHPHLSLTPARSDAASLAAPPSFPLPLLPLHEKSTRVFFFWVGGVMHLAVPAFAPHPPWMCVERESV